MTEKEAIEYGKKIMETLPGGLGHKDVLLVLDMLRIAIEKAFLVVANLPEPVVEADAESRCPECGELEPVLQCEHCGHKWSRTA